MKLSGSNLIYELNNFSNSDIIRNDLKSDSNDFLPNSNEFIDLFENKYKGSTYNFSITNDSEYILILNPGKGIIYRHDIYIIPPFTTFNFIACIFSVEHPIIGIVKDEREESN